MVSALPDPEPELADDTAPELAEELPGAAAEVVPAEVVPAGVVDPLALDPEDEHPVAMRIGTRATAAPINPSRPRLTDTDTWFSFVC
jgi:hypothetical protein